MNWQAEDGTLHENCAVIGKIGEEFGGLSNMATGYPLRVNGVLIGSSEALYQACRFPQNPAWQQEIVDQANPRTAKMKAKKDGRLKDHSRTDWDEIKVDVMRWVLRVKLAQHFPEMTGLLKSTGTRIIVELSTDDRFWGAVEEKDGVLRGRNQLGMLLMELREVVLTKERSELQEVIPPPIPDLMLMGKPMAALRIGAARRA